MHKHLVQRRIDNGNVLKADGGKCLNKQAYITSVKKAYALPVPCNCADTIKLRQAVGAFEGDALDVAAR